MLKYIFLLVSLLTVSVAREIELSPHNFINIIYDTNYNGATSVNYTLTREQVLAKSISKRPYFHVDRRLPYRNRVSTSLYKHSKYQRGHIASDSSFDFSKESLKEAYYMTNIVPQTPQVNKILWYRLERYERYLARKYGTVTVYNYIKYNKKSFMYTKRRKIKKLYIPTRLYKKFVFSNKEECYFVDNLFFKRTYTKKWRITDGKVDCNIIP